MFKLIFGTLVHSVSIVADGYNNLSDAGSNIATFFGFKLANKHPDAEHPYGHGRFEYITGLGISFLIILDKRGSGRYIRLATRRWRRNVKGIRCSVRRCV